MTVLVCYGKYLSKPAHVATSSATDRYIHDMKVDQWNPDHLPFNDPAKSRLVAIVTGANTGLGYLVTLQLYLHGWTVYLGCRSTLRAFNAISDIRAASSTRNPAQLGSLHVLPMDLVSLSSVRDAIEIFQLKEPKLDLLINNAGIMAVPFSLTNDNYEIQLQVNHISPFFLTYALIPQLLKSTCIPPRVIFLSSIGHNMAWPAMDYLSSDFRPNLFWAFRRYGISKTAGIHSAIAFGQRYPSVLFLAVHPGFSLNTGILKHYSCRRYTGSFYKAGFRAFNRVFGVDPEHASWAVLQAALSPSYTTSQNGSYLVEYGQVFQPSEWVVQPQAVRTTWHWTVNQLVVRNYISKE